MSKQKSITIERTGNKLIVPDKLSYKDAIEALKRQMEYEETDCSFIYSLRNAHPYDAVYMFIKYMQEELGTLTQAGNNPTTLELQVDVDKSVTIPLSNLQFSGLGDAIINFDHAFETQLTRAINVEIETKQKYKDLLNTIMIEIKDKISEKRDSIYKGKAIYYDVTGNYVEDMLVKADTVPNIKFLNYQELGEDQLVFNGDVDIQIRTNIYSPIENGIMLEQANISRKWGILLYGEYGVGKTVLSQVISRKATKNGYTFIYLKDPTKFFAAYEFALQYSPAVLFIEDIEKILSGERNVTKDKIANILDGIDTKDKNVILLATTNHIEMINPVFLRFGRFDQIINIPKPDQYSVIRLLELYGGDYIDKNDDYSEVGMLLANQTPATIKNCIEKAKLYAMYFDGNVSKISPLALLNAAKQMTNQINLLDKLTQPKNDPYREGIEGLANIFKLINNGVTS